MSLVFRERKTIGKEPGDILVDVFINRGKGLHCYLLLKYVEGENFRIMGGGPIATQLYAADEMIQMRDVKRRYFTHMIMQ